MLKKISLMSTTLVGLIHLPLLAQTATVQSSSQEATVSGNNNQVIQTTNQVIINHPGQGLQNRYKEQPSNGNAQFSSSSDDHNRGNHYGQRKHDRNNEN
ncbi:hypothetical protein [Gloeothece verrucosa]|uniref:Uncharacterized protein n=1 Tax=Gloeothece verrucosa (strain PCC 7822) TaxID=497965 RepID=E0UK82_GLOV7|nr:hypothetical protein [Gloeothece verrucosa]ADN15844.1 conserved hypothetical protein [Gloeothece verrucosa PCC 7822]